MNSVDRGATWQDATQGLFGCSRRVIASDPARPGTALAGGVVEEHAYLTRLAPDGSIDFSTYLTHRGYLSIASDGLGSVYVAGTDNMHGVANSDALVMKNSPDAGSLIPRPIPGPCSPFAPGDCRRRPDLR